MEKLKIANQANDFMREDNLYLTVGEAVASLSPIMKSQSASMEEGTQPNLPHS